MRPRLTQSHRIAHRLVVDEARSFLESHPERFDLLQMSLVDTWAATGAGAFSLSENALYTVEAWRLFLGSLVPDGIFTVSRWHSEADLGEAGRVISLAVAALFEIGAKDPSRHIALVAVGNLCTVLIRRTPFDGADLRQIRKVCDDLGFALVVMPGESPRGVLNRLLTVTSPAGLFRVSDHYDLNYVPPTDDNPYFFNMLRPRMLEARNIIRSPGVGVAAGNLTATVTLTVLIAILLLLACATIILPLWVHSMISGGNPAGGGARWTGGFYFSLIGLGFMLLEIGLIQRLSVYLGHPIYALGILLFTIIASTGLGSYVSERLPLLNRRYLLGLPFATALVILLANALLPRIITNTIGMHTSTKIALSVLMTAPLGFTPGMFFPTCMGLED